MTNSEHEADPGRSPDAVSTAVLGGCVLQVMLLFGVGLLLDSFVSGNLGFWLTAPLAAAIPLIWMRTILARANENDPVANVLVPLWAAISMIALPVLWFLGRQ